ncbi:MAG: hypothetical protein R2784_15510 [Saprospiraceae bacterium]
MKPSQTDCPEFPELRDYLNLFCLKSGTASEDLNEEEFYLEQPCKEITDEEGIFRPSFIFNKEMANTLKSVDGNVKAAVLGE